MKEYSIQKLVYLTSGVLLFGYFCTFLCVNVIKPNSDILLEKWWWLVPVILSWMPLVVFFASYVLYDFLMISDEYQRIRSLLYASVISFGLLVVIIAAPVKYFADINFHALNGVVAVISAANLFFHYTAGRRLIETGFSVSRYLATLQRVTDITNRARKKKWSIALDGFISLFALPLVWGFRNSIFVVSCAVIAALILYLLVRYLQACKEIDTTIEIRPRLAIISCISCITLGVLAYCTLEFKLPAFVLLCISILPKFIIDNRYARYLYSHLESSDAVAES